LSFRACLRRQARREICLSFFVEPQQPTRLGHAIFALFFALGIAALSSLAQTSPASFPGPEPANVPQDFITKTGDFGNQAETDVIILLERSRHLYLRDSAGIEHLLNPLAFSKEREQTSFTYASNEADPWVLAFKQRKTEPIWEIFTQIGLITVFLIQFPPATLKSSSRRGLSRRFGPRLSRLGRRKKKALTVTVT